jgi:hypothetical protein
MTRMPSATPAPLWKTRCWPRCLPWSRARRGGRIEKEREGGGVGGGTPLIPGTLLVSADVIQPIPKISFMVSADVSQPIPIIFCIGWITPAVTNKARPINTHHCLDRAHSGGCPILPSLRTYPILPRLKLVRSGLSILSNFTKTANLSDFTRAENWSDLACLFCPILPSLRTYPILPGLKTGPIWLVRFVRFYQACELIRFYQG